MVALPRGRAQSLRRTVGGRVPSSRTVATVAVIVATAVLMLEFGIWYFAGLIVLYAGLDIAQRLEERRDGRTMAAILRTAGRSARGVSFKGQARHCERAAWIAREMGWLAQPMVRERLWRHSIRFVPVTAAAPLSALLQALERDKLISRIDVPESLPRLSSGTGKQSFREAGRDI